MRAGLDADTLRERKRAEFERLAREYGELLASWRGYGSTGAHVAHDLNNAYLVSVAAYEECVPGLERVLAQAGNDLAAFFERVKALAREDEAARHENVCTTKTSLPSSVKKLSWGL